MEALPSIPIRLNDVQKGQVSYESTVSKQYAVLYVFHISIRMPGVQNTQSITGDTRFITECLHSLNMVVTFRSVWPTFRDSSVGIATRYGWDGTGIESRWGAIFRIRPDWTWGPPSLLYNEYRVFPGGKAAGAWR